eukprot:g18729.t1
MVRHWRPISNSNAFTWGILVTVVQRAQYSLQICYSWRLSCADVHLIWRYIIQTSTHSGKVLNESSPANKNALTFIFPGLARGLLTSPSQSLTNHMHCATFTFTFPAASDKELQYILTSTVFMIDIGSFSHQRLRNFQPPCLSWIKDSSALPGLHGSHCIGSPCLTSDCPTSKCPSNAAATNVAAAKSAVFPFLVFMVDICSLPHQSLSQF